MGFANEEYADCEAESTYKDLVFFWRVSGRLLNLIWYMRPSKYIDTKFNNVFVFSRDQLGGMSGWWSSLPDNNPPKMGKIIEF